ncbi:heme-binding domain-containing protein [Paraburkholderia sp.]|uniref:heme-binding domain-containing protein n=1 Tax=Paraburkholderia sp. TaxID=1926495 RepID=UPI0039C97F39
MLGYFSLSGYACYHDTNYAKRSMTLASYPVENGRIRTLLDEKACYYCHSRHTVLPGYARLPGIDAMWEGRGSKPDWSKTELAHSFSPKRSNPVPGPAFAEKQE